MPTIAAYLIALAGVFTRVYLPYVAKKLSAGPGKMVWSWREAAAPGLIGLSSWVTLVASGVLESTDWRTALVVGLTAALVNHGAADLLRVSGKAAPLVLDAIADYMLKPRRVDGG